MAKSVTHTTDPTEPVRGIVDYINRLMIEIQLLGMYNVILDERQARQVINQLMNGLKLAEQMERLVKERLFEERK